MKIIISTLVMLVALNASAVYNNFWTTNKDGYIVANGAAQLGITNGSGGGSGNATTNAGAQAWSGINYFNNAGNVFVGNGSGLTNSHIGNLAGIPAPGSLVSSNEAAAIAVAYGGGSSNGNVNSNNSVAFIAQVTATNTANVFAGSGAGLTGMTAAQVGAISTNVNISYAYQTNSKIYNVLDWGATCSGSNYNGVTVVAGSTTLTVTNGQFNSGDVGKFVRVLLAGGTNGAGGYADLVTFITAVGSANSITISNASPNGITNSLVQFGWDDTAAVQALLTYVGTNANPGGTLYFPGSAIIAGPLQDVSTAWTNHHNSQLIAPAMPRNQYGSIDIVFSGPRVAGQNQIFAPVTIGNPQASFSTYGGGLWSFLPFAPTTEHASVIDFRNFATPTVAGDNTHNGGYLIPLNNVKASSMNLTWSMCWDSNLRLLNFEGADQQDVENNTVTMGWNNNQEFYLPVTMPNTVGYAMSGFFNNNNSVSRDNMIGSGFYNGIYAGDNAHMDNDIIFAAINGLTLPNGTAGPIFLRGLQFQECSNCIVSVVTNSGTRVYGNALFVNNYLTTNAHDYVDIPGLSLLGNVDEDDLNQNHTSVVGGGSQPTGFIHYYSLGTGAQQKHINQAEQVIQNGTAGGTAFALQIGADFQGVKMTPNTAKHAAITFPGDNALSWATPLIAENAFNSGNTILELGGDDNYSGYSWGGTNYSGATGIRFYTSASTSSGSVVQHENIDGSGNFYSIAGTETLGTAANPWAAIYGTFTGNGSGLTNYYYPSNSWPANLAALTNGMTTGGYKFANSNGWPVLLWYSNAVLQIELKP